MTNTVFSPISAIPIFYNGTPAVGAKVYFYEGSTTTPSSIWNNADASTASPNPVTADGNGVIPPIWVSGTGSYRVVINTATGQLIRTIGGLPGAAPEVTVVGGTSSYALTTGDIKWNFDSNEQTGFVKLNAQTIGNAGSGAHYADDALTTLFQYLWLRLNNIDCPVSGGRGASGLADFNAGKTLGLPDMRFRCLIGRSGMGNTVSGFAVDYANADNVGVGGGFNNAVLVAGNLPAHTHSGTTAGGAGTIIGLTAIDGAHTHNSQVTDNAGAHNHGYTSPASVPVNAAAGSGLFVGIDTTPRTTTDGTHNHTMTVSTTGSAHQHGVGLDPTTHIHGFTTDNGTGAGTRFDVMNPFRAATCYMKT